MLQIPPADPSVLLALVAAVGSEEANARVRRAHGRGVATSRRIAFHAGLLVIVVALAGPLDAAAARSLSMHMVQHLLLTMVAAPLLLLAAPLSLALRAWPGRPRRFLLAVLHSRFVRIVANPMVAWAMFFTLLWATHVTSLYDATLRSDPLHATEHLAYLATALLFWAPVIGRDPMPSRLSYPAKILYLFLAMPAMAFLGLTIASTRRVLYPTYAHIEGVARAIADQQAAGAIMWAVSMVMVLPALVIVMLAWMRADEREADRIDARLAQAKPVSSLEGSS
jgi:cytochrome c oxidase assembly factor CtaG